MNYYWKLSRNAELVTLYLYNEETKTYTKEELLRATQEVKNKRFISQENKTKCIRCFEEGLRLLDE